MKQIWYRKTRMVLMASLLFLLASCIDGYHDDWTFSSGVKNTTLLSPDSVNFSLNPEGTELTAKWPVVYGASGYSFTLYNVDDPTNPVVVGDSNQIVDGCTAVRPFLDDSRYKLVIRTLGNTDQNNKDADSARIATFTNLLPAVAVIPSGVDLYQWFIEHPITPSANEIAYELEIGGTFTLSGPLDFGTQRLTLRGNKARRPTIVCGSAGRFQTTAGLSLKYMNIDCSAIPADATNAALILLSSTPNPAIYLTATQYYPISNPIAIKSCNIKGVNRRLLDNNGIKYCINTMSITNCIISLGAINDGSGGIIFMYNNGGFINDFSMTNSTVYGTVKASSGAYFLRYNNNQGPSTLGYVSGSVKFANNTFYNVVYTGQMANYSGMNKKAVTLTLTNNIFVNTGSSAVTKRLMVQQTNINMNFLNNCFLYDGVFPKANEVDPAYGDKTGFGEDPGFANPDLGDFTVSKTAATIIKNKCGDPRWLPAQ